MTRAALFILFLSILLGCGGMRGAGVPDLTAEAQREYSRALAVLGVDRASGIEALETFVDRHPHSHLADDASLRLAASIFSSAAGEFETVGSGNGWLDLTTGRSSRPAWK